MKVKAIRTHTITSSDKDLYAILDTYLPKLREKSIVAVASEIISIIEGRVVKTSDVDKDDLIAKEAQFYLPRSQNKWNVSLTIARDNLVASAGIDESNGNGCYILWPKDPQESANEIREYLVKRFKRKHVGVIITDSKTTPLRFGVTGFALAYSGFAPLRNYIGKKDLFGRVFEFEKLSLIDSLAAAAVLEMGEGDEKTPISIIDDLHNIIFQSRKPSQKELYELRIAPEEDLYAPILKKVKWYKG
jgi:putative folate metabolism gamma-glutamate ligase